MWKGWEVSFGWKNGKVGKVIISTISTHKSSTYGICERVDKLVLDEKVEKGESNSLDWKKGLMKKK